MIFFLQEYLNETKIVLHTWVLKTELATKEQDYVALNSPHPVSEGV